MQTSLQPLTERGLARLPGKRAAWVAAWALLPWANAGINLVLDTESKSAIWEQSGTVVVLNYAAVSFAIVMAIWGSRLIATRLEDRRGAMPFRELNSIAAPLLGAGGTAIAFGVTAFVEDGAVAAVLRGVTWLGVGVALWTFIWTYVSLHLGLYRLGGERIADVAREDPTLETLEQQRNLLAADALEIDEGTFARVLTIATSVVAITIGRLILDPFGL